MAERPSFPPGVLEALKKGNKLEAVKLLRAATQTGLKEAKMVVDALQAGNAPAAKTDGRPSNSSARTASVGAHAVTPPAPIPGYVPHSKTGLSPGEVPHSGGAGGWVFVVVSAVVVFFALL